MKFTTLSLTCFAALGALLLCSCVQPDTQSEEPPAPTTEDLIAQAVAEPAPKPVQLPVRYQNPGFVTADDAAVDDGFAEDEEVVIKVGANIRSTRGPQPLWDIMKRLAALKGMSVSWSSDVDQNVLVDVDISAGDDYYKAIDNLLRQVDYFHEVKDSTIIVKYKETKTYHVAMPFTHQKYSTATGGNILGSNDENASLEGTISLKSRDNEFDIWKNIQENLDSIIATWSTTTSTPAPAAPAASEGSNTAAAPVLASRQMSTGGNTYTIDKPVGLVTVQAPRPLQEKIKSYLDGIEHELYKQIAIEAKIVEVQLNDYSSLGINWNTLIDSLTIGPGSLSFSNDYSNNNTDLQRREKSANRTITDTLTSNLVNENTSSTTNNSSTDTHGNTTTTSTSTDTISSTSSNGHDYENAATTGMDVVKTVTATVITNAANAASGVISLSSFNFNDFLHALSQQGNTTILANPKLSVMNGQPALITAGKNVTYIDSIESDVTAGTTVTTNYTVNTESVLSGVGLSLTAVINNDNEIILNLVPVTSVLEEPIEYREVGLGSVGLPVINVREMSTMVKVHDGEMLVIGGLISSAEKEAGQNLFPGFADVPVLKYLTGYKEKIKVKRELIILLRPRIL